MSYIAKNANIVKAISWKPPAWESLSQGPDHRPHHPEVGLESHGISQYAVVQPSADLDALKEVFIIKSFSRGEEE
jgi:hypothetical protein